MKSIALLAFGLLASSPAWAQDAASELDRSAPQVPTTYSDGVPTGRDDPPGTYYGDTSGRPARRKASEPVEDGDARVWGSFTTGIGYSKGYGTSHYNAAQINVDKAFGDGDKPKRFNLQINVMQGDGPGFAPGYYEPGPYFPR